jgi:hypothetical protein
VNDLVAVLDERRERFFRECSLAEQCNTQRLILRQFTLPNQKSTCTLKRRCRPGVH